MASEEIGLNHYLKEKGIQAQETDLGELIIQLINEHPVHIVVPAIHKNRKQIGKIFEENSTPLMKKSLKGLMQSPESTCAKNLKALKWGLVGLISLSLMRGRSG